MAVDYTPITPGSGAKIQGFLNTIGADIVKAQAVALVDQFGVPITTTPTGGDVANGATDSGNPVKVGGKANANAPTAVTSGQRVDAWNDPYGRRVVSDFDPELSLTTGITSYRERVVAPRYTILSDSIADGFATFWTPTTANGGTASVATGEGMIQSGTAANGSAQITSTVPLYLPGQSAWLLSAARFGDTGSAGNIRRLGAFTAAATVPQDGFYFELADTTLSAVSVKAGVATSVASASWSRAAIAPFTLDTNYHLWELRWTANWADFYIDSVLRHSATVTNSAITATLNFPMTLQSISTSGTTNRALVVRNIGLGRFGFPDAAPFSPDVIMQSAAAAVGNGTVMNTIGFGTAMVQVTGTFVATLTFEGTVDGTNYFPIVATQEGAAAVSSVAAGTGIYRLSVAGLHNIRARVSAYTSGTVTVLGRTLNAPYAPKFLQAIPPAITKGTQSASGFTTQDLKDAGRTRVTIVFQAVAPATADTLLSLVKSSAGVAATGATSIGVTAGKTFRLTSVSFSIKANAAAAAFATMTLRSNPAGATLISSQSELRLDVGNTGATVGAGDKVEAMFPDGMEFSGAQTIGVSLAAQATTNIISISLHGFEY